MAFKMRRQFVVNVVQTVMITDATNDTSPMSKRNTRTKADIELMFNTISYKKGAAFIRMTKHILGEQKFKKSLNIYLKTHAYKNTIPSDLLNIWKDNCPDAYRAHLKSYFKSFTTQVGYPMVTFNRTSNSTIEVTQKRFLLKDFDTADPNLTYIVPITFTTSLKNNFEKTYPRFFLQDYPYIIPVSKNVSWVIGNIKETGYYRVNYDNNSWNEIAKKLFSKSRNDIHELNRAQIVDDLLNLARAGEIEYSVVLNILQYLVFENNYLPWTAAFNGLSYIMTRLGNEASIFAPFIRDIINGTYNKLGFEEKNWDSTLDIYNRANILAWSCQYGIPGCTTKAKSYFDQKIETNSVPVNIRSVVYCNVVREGNESYFNTLSKKYMTELVASEKNLILDSLGCVKEGKLVDKFFQIIISDAVHPADKYSIYRI